MFLHCMQSVRYPLAQLYRVCRRAVRCMIPLSFTVIRRPWRKNRQGWVFAVKREIHVVAFLHDGIAVPTGWVMPAWLQYAGFRPVNESRVDLLTPAGWGHCWTWAFSLLIMDTGSGLWRRSQQTAWKLGILLHPSINGIWGACTTRLVARLGKSTSPLLKHEKLLAYKIGLGFDVSEQFFISAEIVRRRQTGKPRSPVSVSFDQFLRAGFVSEPVCGGWYKLEIVSDLISLYPPDPQLGFSPGILLIAQRKNKP